MQNFWPEISWIIGRRFYSDLRTVTTRRNDHVKAVHKLLYMVRSNALMEVRQWMRYMLHGYLRCLAFPNIDILFHWREGSIDYAGIDIVLVTVVLHRYWQDVGRRILWSICCLLFCVINTPYCWLNRIIWWFVFYCFRRECHPSCLPM